jgi:hypothetical protein
VLERNRLEGSSGAFFDMNEQPAPRGLDLRRRVGMAILPGLVRYDETFGPAEIDHAFRFTVAPERLRLSRLARGGWHNGALPMGARLPQPGVDISGELPTSRRSSGHETYGLIVADSSSDMFISRRPDVRWSNGS